MATNNWFQIPVTTGLEGSIGEVSGESHNDPFGVVISLFAGGGHDKCRFGSAACVGEVRVCINNFSSVIRAIGVNFSETARF